MYRANEVSVPLESKFPFLLSSVEWVYFVVDDKIVKCIDLETREKRRIGFVGFSVLFQCFCCLETENFVNVIIEFFDIFLPKNFPFCLSKKPNISVNLFCFRYLCTSGVASQADSVMTREQTLWRILRYIVFERLRRQQVSDVCCVIPYFCLRLERMPFDLSTKFLSLKWQISISTLTLLHNRRNLERKFLHALACKSTPNDRQPFISILPLT